MSLAIFVSEACIPPGVVSVKITPQIIVPPSLQQQTTTIITTMAATGRNGPLALHRKEHGGNHCVLLLDNQPRDRATVTAADERIREAATVDEEGDGSGREATKAEVRGGLLVLDDRQ
jgi:hypothetical protein